MTQADSPRQWPDPGVAYRGFSPQRVLPPSHAGPPPPPPPQNPCHHRQIHASRPPSHWSHGVRPPAVPTVPMRAPAVSSGGTSEDFQQIPCHSIPYPPPEAVPPCPSCISGPCIPPKVFRRPSPDVSMPLDKVSIRVDMRFSGPRREKPLLPFRRVSTPLDTPDPWWASRLTRQVSCIPSWAHFPETNQESYRISSFHRRVTSKDDRPVGPTPCPSQSV